MNARYSDFAGPHRLYRRKTNSLSGGSSPIENSGALTCSQNIRELKRRRKLVKSLVSEILALRKKFDLSAGSLENASQLRSPLACAQNSLAEQVRLYPELRTPKVQKAMHRERADSESSASP